MTTLGTVLSYLRDFDAEEAVGERTRAPLGEVGARRTRSAGECLAIYSTGAGAAPLQRTAAHVAARAVHPG